LKHKKKTETATIQGTNERMFPVFLNVIKIHIATGVVSALAFHVSELFASLVIMHGCRSNIHIRRWDLEFLYDNGPRPC
jgi:hypothetical protein